MTKFEEELNKIEVEVQTPLDKYIVEKAASDESLYAQHYEAVLEKFKDWHSDEDYQRAKRMVEHMQFENELLKAKLKQQTLPVVPEFVAELIKDAKENKKTIRWCLYGNCKELYPQAAEWIGAVDDIEFTDKTWKQQELFVRAWLDGYTVEKPQLFYLKNKLTGFYLFKAFGGKYGEEFYRSTINLTDDFKFTQQEISNMETGSYEQIEVVQ